MATITPEMAAVIAMLAPNPAVFRALQAASQRLHATPQQQFAVRCRYRQAHCMRSVDCVTYTVLLPSGRQDGVSMECCGNGSPRKRRSHVNGKLHGIYQDWRESGQLHKLGRHVHGRQHGEWLIWYISGQLYNSVIFVDGKLHGDCVYWDVRGVEVGRQTWTNDVLVKYSGADKFKD